jgi:thiamine pyrophosphokinase
MEKGVGMMMKALGLDPEKIIGDFESLKTTVTSTLKSIDETQIAIKNRQEEIWKLLQAIQNTLSQVQPVQQQPKTQPMLQPPKQ